jgi:hypothetical protein
VILRLGSFLCDPKHKDGDVIVAAGNAQRKEVVAMNKEFYTYIGYAFVLCIKYIFIPIGVAIIGRLLSEKLLPPQPKKRLLGAQRKKRL